MEKVKLPFGDKALVESDNDLRSKFPTRTFGDGEELVELTIAGSFKSLGYIRSDGNCTSSHLSSKVKLLSETRFCRDRVDPSGEFSSLFPRGQILKSENFISGPCNRHTVYYAQFG